MSVYSEPCGTEREGLSMRTQVLHLKEYYPFLGEDGADATLTTYLPFNMPEMNRQNQKRPGVVICPGGGYSFCSERESEAVALRLLSAGLNAFVLNYPTAPHRFPAQLLAVAAAFEFIDKNAQEWNCDTQKLLIMGFSAGGHLAAHYSNAYNWPEVRAVFPKSRRPAGSILCYPVISAESDIAHMGSFANLLGCEPDEAQKKRFSCEKLVSEDTPPAFLWHTAEDTAVPVENSLVYARALSEHKIPFELHVYPHGYHGLSTADSETCDNLPANVARVSDWMTQLQKWIKMV